MSVNTKSNIIPFPSAQAPRSSRDGATHNSDPKRPDYFTRWSMVILGIGALAVGGKWVEGELTAPHTVKAVVEFGADGSNDWNAAKEVAKVEGVAPTTNTLDMIDDQLQKAEGDPINGVVQSFEKVNIQIPIGKAYEHENHATGHGITVHFPESK